MAVTALGGDPTAREVALPLIGKSTSRIGYGTGGLLRISSARRRQSTLAAALASGITHFDTAPIYGFGESERALGRFLRGRRGQVTLTTKFGLQPSALAARLAVFQRVGRRALEVFPGLRRVAARNAGVLYAAPHFSVNAVRASLEASLRALRTDYVDFFLAHQASHEALPGEEVMSLLEALRREGKILEFGVATEFDWLPPVLQQRPQLSRVVQFDSDLTRGNALGLVAGTDSLRITYGFISRGIAACRERLSRAGASAPVDPAHERIDDDTLAGLLLRAAVLANPRGIVLMQSRSAARIESNVRAANSNGDDELVQRLVNLVGPSR